MKPIFPNLEDYPSDLLAPKDDISYAKVVESSGIAYFYGNPVARWLFKKRLVKAFEWLEKAHVSSIFDAGTGIGYFLPALASLARKVEAIDYHAESLDVARFMIQKRGITNVNLAHGDILGMDYANENFDAVVCLSVLEHIENLDQALSEMKRVLKPGGILIAGYPMEDAVMRFFQELDRKTFFRKYNTIFKGSVEAGKVVGHVSDWRKIDRALAGQFIMKEKDYISIIPRVGRVYALRLAKKT